MNDLKNKRIITADIHGVAGLGNFSYRKQLASELLSKTHYHRSFCEIHCIMKGDWVTNIIEGEKMESYRLSGGEGLIVYPGETHNSGVVQQGPSPPLPTPEKGGLPSGRLLQTLQNRPV